MSDSNFSIYSPKANTTFPEGISYAWNFPQFNEFFRFIISLTSSWMSHNNQSVSVKIKECMYVYVCICVSEESI